MLVVGLVTETLMGIILGLFVPHAGRRAELFLSTIGVMVVLLVTSFIQSLRFMDVFVLIMGWFSTAIGISVGKYVRLRIEANYVQEQLGVIMPLMSQFFATCDRYVHGTASKQELEQAWGEARDSLSNYTSFSSLARVGEELYDLTMMLSEDGLTDKEEEIWRKTVGKATQMVHAIA